MDLWFLPWCSKRNDCCNLIYSSLLFYLFYFAARLPRPSHAAIEPFDYRIAMRRE